MITSKDLKFIEAVVAKGNQKIELNFARFDFTKGVVFASDAQRVLKFYNDFGAKNNGVAMAHKQTLKAITAIAGGKEQCLFFERGNVFFKDAKIPLDNAQKEGTVNFDEIGLKSGLPVQVEVEKIAFEIYKRGIFFFDGFLNPLIAHSKGAELKYLLYTNGENEPFVIEAVNNEGDIAFDYVINPIR